ncbi:PKD domain-containing protein [Sulfuricurvum sp.]|uniref:PKD domain-containing protein n=1 Tax=Sulfuricurvum sp. TaxID=2025608 RepID=UPI003562BB47
MTWEDDFHDTTKIKPSTDKRILQYTAEGLIKANKLAQECLMVSDAEINTFYSAIVLGGSSSITSDTPTFPVGRNKAAKVITNGGPVAVFKYYVSGAGLCVGGWNDWKASFYLLIDATIIAGDVDVGFYAFQRATDDFATGYASLPYAYIGTSSGQFFKVVPDGNGIAIDSEIAMPTLAKTPQGEWVKMTIEKSGDRILYHVLKESTSEEETSDISPIFEDFDGPVCLEILFTGGVGVHTVYMDSQRLETFLNQNDDEIQYPDHQQEFETINIAPSNWYQWDKITLVKSGESIPNRKMITTTVLNSVGVPIAGYEDLTAAEIDIHDITESSISLLIKFRNEEGYDSPILQDLKVTYFVTGGEVSLAVTENTYNDDIITPIVTKTGYRLTFDATSVEPEDPDVTVTHYWFDFGDGLNSGWITHNVVNHVYNKHSQNELSGVFDAKVKVKYSNGAVSGWSNTIEVNAQNSAPVARLWVKPLVSRLSGAGISTLSFFGNDSYDVDDNGYIASGNGYRFDYGDGTPEAWQTSPYAQHTYSGAGIFVVGLTVKDDLNEASDKILMKIKILDLLTATTISFNRHPRQVDVDLKSDYQITQNIGGGYPDVEGLGTMNKVLKIAGQAHMTEADITLMEGYVIGQTLVRFNYFDVTGATKEFTGYILSFNHSRRGGYIDDVPWTAVIQYKSV